jgi:predicted RNase H-like nuclease (RuvC/YqgF family)
MPSSLSSYPQENALLFAKLQELDSKMKALIKDKEISQQRIKGLEFNIDKLLAKNEMLEKELNLANKETQALKKSTQNINALEKQNFSIRNKIAKIATDIHSQEVSD